MTLAGPKSRELRRSPERSAASTSIAKRSRPPSKRSAAFVCAKLVVGIVMAMSSAASRRRMVVFRNQCLLAGIVLVFHQLGQRQQFRAEAKPRALSRCRVDRKSELPVLDKQLRDAAKCRERIEITDSEHGRVLDER